MTPLHFGSYPSQHAHPIICLRVIGGSLVDEPNPCHVTWATSSRTCHARPDKTNPQILLLLSSGQVRSDRPRGLLLMTHPLSTWHTINCSLFIHRKITLPIFVMFVLFSPHRERK
ncbi:hypothetical protein L2E82_08391 [Cichorium intybus]|uniref:Uncharacterized protein n=1 Tax=Cichorium intybus TaxID=13427 RepID=A0ACB9G6E6_CICIN|nr:hypothetical protein L2E82_08391 [Cichorium intybus]